MIRVGGFRVAEHAQKTQIKADEYEYPSGSKVIKAFTSLDWHFYDASGCLITLHSLDDLAKAPKKLQITFRIQKNCKMVRRSPSLLMTSILIFAQFAQHIVFSFKQKDLAKLMTSPWVFILTIKVLSNISLGIKLQSCSNPLQSIAILILGETRCHVSLPILEEFGLLSYLTRPE